MFPNNMRIRRALIGTALVLLPWGSLAAASGNDGDQGQQDVLITEQEQQRYERRMRQALDEWGNRVENAKEASRRELSDIWRDVRQDWRKLEDASGEAWQESREVFEDSMRTLEKRWEELES